MKELKEARMGMIAVAAVMLVSVARQLMGVRRLSSGMMVLVVGRDRAVRGMKKPGSPLSRPESCQES